MSWARLLGPFFCTIVSNLSKNLALLRRLTTSWNPAGFIIPFSLKATQKYGKNLIIKNFPRLIFYLKLVAFS